jgi:Prophage maintenance system killer protein
VVFRDGEAVVALCVDGLECELADAVVMAHDQLVAVRGYNPQLNEKQHGEMTGKVLSVISSAFCTYFGNSPSERYKDVFVQIADFATRLSRDHIFPDGNKRTTVVVSLALLRMRGVDIDVEDTPCPEDNVIYQWIQDIVTGGRTTDELANLLRDAACPYPRI